jgi:hypothetical protein
MSNEVPPPELIAALFWYMGALPLVVHAVEMAETRGKRKAIAFYLVAVSVWAAIVYVFLLPYFRALTRQIAGSIEHVWWAFGAVGTVAGIFIVVGMLRDQSLGPMQPKTLRDDGLVMLAVTAAFALGWYLWVDPGVLT